MALTAVERPLRFAVRLTIFPSVAIFLTVFALNQFGEGLREATDPRVVR